MLSHSTKFYASLNAALHIAFQCNLQCSIVDWPCRILLRTQHLSKSRFVPLYYVHSRVEQICFWKCWVTQQNSTPVWMLHCILHWNEYAIIRSTVSFPCRILGGSTSYQSSLDNRLCIVEWIKSAFGSVELLNKILRQVWMLHCKLHSNAICNAALFISM